MARRKLEDEPKPSAKKKTTAKKKTKAEPKSAKTSKVKKAKQVKTKPVNADKPIDATVLVHEAYPKPIKWQDAVWPTKLMDSKPDDKDLTLDELLVLYYEDADGNDETEVDSDMNSTDFFDEFDKRIAVIVAHYEAVAGPILDQHDERFHVNMI